MHISRDDLRTLLEDRLDRKTNSDIRAAWMIAACLCELPLRAHRQPSGSAASYTPLRLIPRVGRARFLDAALRECEASADHLHACLFEPWQYHRGAQSLRWDPGAAIPARALMAGAPAHLGTSGVPGAVLLAIRGLSQFPLVTSQAGRKARAAPPGMPERKDFIWPTWSEPLSERTTRIMLSMPWLYELCAARDKELQTTHATAGIRQEREIKNKLARAQRQLRAHGVRACYIATRVHLSDDNEALGWGKPILV
jgi:hypothetical protein